MRTRTRMLTGGLLLACTLPALSSSHREAPFIAGHPKVDGTDFYMFRSYESRRAAFVTLIANYQPLQDAYGGPNYFSLDPDALYEIHVDNNGDAREDLTFQFRFTNRYGQADIPSARRERRQGPGQRRSRGRRAGAAGQHRPGSGASTGALNVRRDLQPSPWSAAIAAAARRRRSPMPAAAARTFTKPVDNIGTKSIPDYAGYADAQLSGTTSTIPGCADAGRLFVGQRREGFVVNLGQVFDQINLNPLRRAQLGLQHHRRQERHLAGAGSARRLPDRGQRPGDRRLDHGQPAPGAPAQPGAGRPGGRRPRPGPGPSRAAPGPRCRASAARWSTKS